MKHATTREPRDSTSFSWPTITLRLPDRVEFEVVPHRLRERACRVLRRYREMGGFVYNAGARGDLPPSS